MFLSRIAINRRLLQSKRALTAPQMMHAAVLDSFPPWEGGAGKEEKPRVLWRTDLIDNYTWLYVVSQSKPDFRHIIEQFGWPGSDQSWETMDYAVFLSQIKNGQQWHFRLHANPVHTVEGKIYPHITAEQQKKWLRDRSEKNGFMLAHVGNEDGPMDTFEIVYRNIQRFKKKATDKNYVTLSVVTFEGDLMVEDAEVLRKTLCRGVGRAKAYGCGLITLAQR